MIKENTTLEKQFLIKDSDTANVVGSGSLDVLATPILIAFMENTAFISLEEQLSDNETSVGTSISVKHLKPSLVGEAVTVVSTILNTEGKKIEFKIEAFNDCKELIGKAEHKRYIVDENFLSRKVNE